MIPGYFRYCHNLREKTLITTKLLTEETENRNLSKRIFKF
jgi:hypothetical protein